ncbi:proteoglycan 4-like [Portunus trituberculatus]|uniref:proteoglycan 4-like n=1 Tax=Portunus trituberculatus TaxID=210409 RepID=UPI001E1CE322|nr:proteoglycan 4-like [Portunus trituberculatus]
MTRSSVFVVWVVLLLAGSRGVRGVPLRGHSGVIFGTEFLRILDDHAGGGGYDEGLEHPARPLARDEGRGEPADTNNDRLSLSSSSVLVESGGGDGGEPVLSSRVSSRGSRRLGSSSSGSSQPPGSSSSGSGSVAASVSGVEGVNRVGVRSQGKVESAPAFSFLSEFSEALNSSTFTEDDYKYLTDYYYFDLYAEDPVTTTIPAPTIRRGERTRLLHPASTTTTEAPPPPRSTTPTTTTEKPPTTTTITTTTTTTTTTTEPPSTTTSTTTEPPSTTTEPPSTTTTTTPAPPSTTIKSPSTTTTTTGSPPRISAAASPRAFRYTTTRPKSGGKSGSRARRPASPARLANKVGDARSRSSASSVVVEVRVESPTTIAPSTTAAAAPRHRGRSARPVQAAEERGTASHLLTHPLVVQTATDHRGTVAPRSAVTTDVPPTTTTTTTTAATTTTTAATTTTTTTAAASVGGEAEAVEQSVVASVTRSEAQNSAPQQLPVGFPEAQQGMAPQGLAPFGHAPEGWAPFGTAPEGVAPQGVLPGGAHPEGVAPEGGVGLRLVDASVAAGGAAANSTVGYVVESHNVRRFRHEERTPEGLIIGEYGEVDHQTGDVNGVRYVADSTADPRLIYDSLMTFLQL